MLTVIIDTTYYIFWLRLVFEDFLYVFIIIHLKSSQFLDIVIVFKSHIFVSIHQTFISFFCFFFVFCWDRMVICVRLLFSLSNKYLGSLPCDIDHHFNRIYSTLNIYIFEFVNDQKTPYKQIFILSGLFDRNVKIRWLCLFKINEWKKNDLKVSSLVFFPDIFKL